MNKFVFLAAVAAASITASHAIAQDARSTINVRQTGDDGYIYFGTNASIGGGNIDVRQAGVDNFVKGSTDGGNRVTIDQTATSFNSNAGVGQHDGTRNAQISIRQTGRDIGLVTQLKASASSVSLRQDGQSSAGIYQIGAGNSVQGRQNNNYEEGLTEATHHAIVDQVGTGNTATFNQYTERGSLTIAQGKRDTYKPVIEATGNVATVTQSGTDGSIAISQTGNYNMASALQSGVTNVMKLQQTGNGAVASLTQTGTSLLIDLKQEAAADAALTQTGEDNELFIKQEAAGARIAIMQSGSRNHTMVNQVKY